LEVFIAFSNLLGLEKQNQKPIYRQDFLHINKVTMRQFRRRENRVQLYFNCSERMDHIERILRRVDYKDIVFIMNVGGDYGPTKLKVKFGRGWMRKGAEIHAVNNLRGEPKGIRVSITISEFTRVYGCCIENQKDRKDGICLGMPDGISYPCYRILYPELQHRTERREEAEEMNEIRREITEISDEILNWEEEMLDDMQIEAEMKEALQGQVDWGCQVVTWRGFTV
jgi:hypothetical protein